jgi:hypothetical protein
MGAVFPNIIKKEKTLNRVIKYPIKHDFDISLMASNKVLNASFPPKIGSI